MLQNRPEVQNTNVYKMVTKLRGNTMELMELFKKTKRKKKKCTHLSPRPKIYPTIDMTANERV